MCDTNGEEEKSQEEKILDRIIALFPECEKGEELDRIVANVISGSISPWLDSVLFPIVLK